MSFVDPAHPPTTTCDRFLETDRSEASTESSSGSSEDSGSGRQRGVASQRNVALCEAEAVVLAKQTAFSRLGAFCISNPLLPDCPLTYCNKTFSEQTGFEPEDIVGRNCRFLQCGETSRETVAAMGECVSHFRRRRRGDGDVGAQTFRIINAKKDGTRFLNLVHIAPIYDSDGKLVRMLGCQFGLGLVAGSEMQKLFQGVVTKADFEAVEGRTHEQVLREWSGWRRQNANPATREQVVMHMEQLMTATIGDLLKSMDWDSVTKLCAELQEKSAKASEAPFRSAASEKRPFAGAAGGPTGAPGQALQKRARS